MRNEKSGEKGNSERKRKAARAVPIWLGILVFALAFGAGVASKVAIKPSWAQEYAVEWGDAVGTLVSDVPYGPGDANTFDLYLPADGGKKAYGLVVHLHAGGFTSGDKAGDRDTLAWLCSKGYVAAGINYTLRTEANDASVYTQSMEIREAIPQVVEEARRLGYPIDEMAVAGGSAGHALAMIYAYRDGAQAPVPVALTFGAVGPSSFYQEDWGVLGLDRSDEACAELFGVMAGQPITADEVADGSYLEKMKPIAAAEWVGGNPVPAVVAYGTCDRVQPFAASLRLKGALEENGVDHRYFEMPHSGHGLQNDDAIYEQYMKAVEEYLAKYLSAE